MLENLKVKTTLARWSGRKLNQRMEVGARLVESDLRHWDGRRSGDLPLNQSETQRQSGPWIFPGEREARTRKVFVGEGSPYFRVDRGSLCCCRVEWIVEPLMRNGTPRLDYRRGARKRAREKSLTSIAFLCRVKRGVSLHRDWDNRTFTWPQE